MGPTFEVAPAARFAPARMHLDARPNSSAAGRMEHLRSQAGATSGTVRNWESCEKAQTGQAATGRTAGQPFLNAC
jgi:hypothetical protein